MWRSYKGTWIKMSRISAKFAELAGRNERALVAYVMAGYPSRDATLAAVRGLVRGGADVIELGLPFSDPLADGPVIQDASTASLARGTTVSEFFAMAKEIRRATETPLALMTYSNVPYRLGYGAFAKRAKDAGIDGIILPDMPIEESAEYLKSTAGRLDAIFLASPNTARPRMQRIARTASGFLYLVAVYGTTGTRTGVSDYAIRAVKSAKRAAGKGIPVGVGFGVSSPDDVKRYVAAGADAVIVGSAFLRLIGKTPQNKMESRVASFARSLKKATIP